MIPLAICTVPSAFLNIHVLVKLAKFANRTKTSLPSIFRLQLRFFAFAMTISFIFLFYWVNFSYYFFSIFIFFLFIFIQICSFTLKFIYQKYRFQRIVLGLKIGSFVLFKEVVKISVLKLLVQICQQSVFILFLKYLYL